jgi:signal peptidase I
MGCTLAVICYIKACMNEDPAQQYSSQRPVRGGRGKEHSAWFDFFSTVGILITALLVAFLLITFVFRSYEVDGPSMQNTLHNDDKLIIWKVPRTWARITGHEYVPKRGDIIVFTESGLAAYGQANTKQLIKRVIGLPGDRVVVSNGVYTIYNIDITLGPDQLFVSGDNRPDSLDSRSFGPINANQVIGQLLVRVFPLNDAKVF